jgi:hypothetical protein
MNAAQTRFIDDMGQHMLGWGLPRTTGRIYAYLLLRSGPADLDQITKDLRVAKSGASVSTRQLIQFGMVRASGERGSRRLRYEALYDIDAIIAARTAQSLAFFERLREGARIAPAPAVRQKLRTMTADLEQLFGRAPDIVSREKRRSL